MGAGALTFQCVVGAMIGISYHAHCIRSYCMACLHFELLYCCASRQVGLKGNGAPARISSNILKITASIAGVTISFVGVLSIRYIFLPLALEIAL